MAKNKLDATGFKCPMPLIMVTNTLKQMKIGESLEASANDPMFIPDIKAYCEKVGDASLDSFIEDKDVTIAIITKKF